MVLLGIHAQILLPIGVWALTDPFAAGLALLPEVTETQLPLSCAPAHEHCSDIGHVHKLPSGQAMDWKTFGPVFSRRQLVDLFFEHGIAVDS